MIRVRWLTPPLVYIYVYVGAAPPHVALVSVELHSLGLGSSPHPLGLLESGLLASVYINKVIA